MLVVLCVVGDSAGGPSLRSEEIIFYWNFAHFHNHTTIWKTKNDSSICWVEEKIDQSMHALQHATDRFCKMDTMKILMILWHNGKYFDIVLYLNYLAHYQSKEGTEIYKLHWNPT